MTPLAAVSADKVTPGVLGFLVTLALGVATWLLLRSMTRHLKRVTFVEEPPRPARRSTTQQPPADDVEPPPAQPRSPEDGAGPGPSG